MIRITLAEAQAKPFTAAERAHFATLAAKPDSEIDFSDQESVAPEAIAAGHYVIIHRGGARLGAERKPSGRQQVSLRLLPPPCGGCAPKPNARARSSPPWLSRGSRAKARRVRQP
jgi:hypothetical protein